jgi:hypothetical protein
MTQFQMSSSTQWELSSADDTDMYTWQENILDPGELWAQTQMEIKQWCCLLNPTGGALKPEKCWWYLLDYTCFDGK